MIDDLDFTPLPSVPSEDAAPIGPCPVCQCRYPAYLQCVGPVGCGGPRGNGAPYPCPTCPRPVPTETEV